jgi:prophage regulatory protein
MKWMFSVPYSSVAEFGLCRKIFVANEVVRKHLLEKYLRRPAVEYATGLSRSTIYALMDTGDFPRPIRIGKRAVAWPESAIEKWLASRPISNGAK